MFLLYLTLIVLTILLVTKYITSKHLSILKQRQLELENHCARSEQQYKAHRKTRRKTEAGINSLRKERDQFKSRLEELEGELQELEERIQDKDRHRQARE